jgi:hypothetical protein
MYTYNVYYSVQQNALTDSFATFPHTLIYSPTCFGPFWAIVRDIIENKMYRIFVYVVNRQYSSHRCKLANNTVVQQIKTHFVFYKLFFFFRKSWRWWDNVKLYGTAGQATDGNSIWCMRFAAEWVTLQTHDQKVQYWMLFHHNNCTANAPLCFIICTAPVWFLP